MATNIARFKEELNALVEEGDNLRLALVLDLKLTDKKTEKQLSELRLPRFKEKYERWYSLSLEVVKQLIPDRLADFVKQYKDEKRKQTDFLTYGISDYMIGLQTTRGGEVLADGKAAFPKFEQQLNILAVKKANPTINDLNQLLKDNNAIDTPTWRFVQHLADLRNLCDHNKNREPTKDEVNDLISGASKITKTVF